MSRGRYLKNTDGSWRPTTQMENYLRAWREAPLKTVDEILLSCGLDRTWYYEKFWYIKEAREWWEKEREKVCSGEHVQQVHQAVFTGAVAPGPYQHHFTNQYLKRFDSKYADRSEINANVTVRMQGGMDPKDRLGMLIDVHARIKEKIKALPPASDPDVIEGEIVLEKKDAVPA